MKRRNMEELSVPEANRKKKKKQITTPRPACSWVQFSREFIKEYSASHREASGLKAATKAASEAWKSMGPEEKDKYTRRAREVRDSYLSAAPAREPKLKRQAKLITRCSPGRLLNVIQRLNQEQIDSVKNMGFGSLLGLRCRTLRRNLCLWLLERFNAARSSLNICGERIPLSARDVELVLGLAANGKDVVNSGPDELITELRKSYNASNGGISLRLLEDRLSAPEAGDDFKRSFVLYALGTLLCPTARLDVSPSFLHFLTNMDAIHQYNWAKFLLDRLVREISRFRQGKQHAVGGCLLFLQLFYYERIAVGGPCESVPTVVPCLFSWGEEEITEREKREKELGGYGRGEVVYKEQCIRLEITNRVQQDAAPVGELGSAFGDNLDFTDEDILENIPISLEKGHLVFDDEEMPFESVAASCRNEDYGCTHTEDYIEETEHEAEYMFAALECPLQDCSFVGSCEQLSLHFSTEHWGSGQRFRYNSPFAISLHKDEQLVVLQSEEDGLLFLLNKGSENIGYTLMITCISPSSFKEGFFYDIVTDRGCSSLRLKSRTLNHPGSVEVLPPVDFLLIPFGYLSSSGYLNLEVCIWSSELGSS